MVDIRDRDISLIYFTLPDAILWKLGLNSVSQYMCEKVQIYQSAVNKLHMYKSTFNIKIDPRRCTRKFTYLQVLLGSKTPTNNKMIHEFGVNATSQRIFYQIQN